MQSKEVEYNGQSWSIAAGAMIWKAFCKHDRDGAGGKSLGRQLQGRGAGRIQTVLRTIVPRTQKFFHVCMDTVYAWRTNFAVT